MIQPFELQRAPGMLIKLLTFALVCVYISLSVTSLRCVQVSSRRRSLDDGRKEEQVANRSQTEVC